MLKESSKHVEVKPRASSRVLTLTDFSKGLAIIAVYLFHFRLLGLGWQGVHIFVVLSGLTLTYSCQKRSVQTPWKKWYFKRLRRILPTYWLISFLGYLVVSFLLALQGNSLIQSFWLAKRTLFFDFTLLKVFDYQELSTFPNVSLWFIPFILSFYLVFPVLYHWLSQCKNLVHIFLFLFGMIGVEFIYRAVAIYWLDGNPIAYNSLAGLPLDKIPSSFPFQLGAPFGLFPSRIGEFALGMTLGLFLFQHEKEVNKILLNWKTGVLGFLVWLLAIQFINTGILGWITGDFLIALGLFVWIYSIASVIKLISFRIFSKISKIGADSYYIFLVHAIFIQVFFSYLDGQQGSEYVPFSQPIFGLISFASILGLVVVSSNALKRFDQSKFADWIAHSTFAKLFGSL